MGFTINETIETTLHYKDIALIAVAMGEYQRLYKDTADKDVLKRMERLVNRLGEEMYDHPDGEDDDNDDEDFKKSESDFRKIKESFESLYIPSEALADVIGSNEKILRTDAVKKLWSYIKENKLQDEKLRRYINLDEKLKKVFPINKDKISMFDMAKHLNNQLTKAE